MPLKMFVYFQTLDELTDAAVPNKIQLGRDLDLEKAYSK